MKLPAGALLLILLAGCTSTVSTIWIDDGIREEGGERSDILVRVYGSSDSPRVMVSVTERARAVPGRTYTITRAELEVVKPIDVPTRLANVPFGAVFIALSPVGLPIGLLAQIGGAKSIGHGGPPVMLPILMVMGGATHLVPVGESHMSFLIRPDEEAEYRRTGRVEYETAEATSGTLVREGSTDAEYRDSPGYIPSRSLQLYDGELTLPRFGITVRLVDHAGRFTHSAETRSSGLVGFQFPEGARPEGGFDVVVEIDGDTWVHRVDDLGPGFPDPHVFTR